MIIKSMLGETIRLTATCFLLRRLSMLHYKLWRFGWCHGCIYQTCPIEQPWYLTKHLISLNRYLRCTSESQRASFFFHQFWFDGIFFQTIWYDFIQILTVHYSIHVYNGRVKSNIHLYALCPPRKWDLPKIKISRTLSEAQLALRQFTERYARARALQEPSRHQNHSLLSLNRTPRH